MTPQSFPFSKNRYFPRKRMRSSDFIREQAYVERKLAFLSQWDFGAGVALGLEVLRMDGDSLLVSPGFAVDGYGRWLIVDEPAIYRIRALHGFDALHGETALLWLAYHEEHTDPMFVPGDQGEVREYAAARERFSFYLTDMRLLPEQIYPGLYLPELRQQGNGEGARRTAAWKHGNRRRIEPGNEVDRPDHNYAERKKVGREGKRRMQL